ncbi:F0F1 ATP synthase subunit delta [Telmatospirillum sp.]|uniref:F0F1 ATP synthase subunit delta n=1 Tax=Telmatospirillum sp. TaxID=2079197 RepID=UPI0028453625|nr:F0F1 ATP synthase subunit delta [Telmatospirillum sp.]MDR3441096.1 F0F1 ATP synthase subunit delta [Telmatospirillum sp.]
MSSKATGSIAERYSVALFELAEQQSALDAVASDLKGLRVLIAESKDLRSLLNSPVLSRSEQQKAISALAERAGFGVLTKNFLGLVARNRRLFAVDGMIAAYLARLASKRGEVTAEVASAIPLASAQIGAIEAALKKVVGSNVTVDAIVDPGLLGGLVVKIGSRMVDGSLKTKLQHLQLAMKGVG